MEGANKSSLDGGQAEQENVIYKSHLHTHLCLASLHNVFKIHSCSNRYQNFIPNYGWIIVCCMGRPHFIYPFISRWTFFLNFYFGALMNNATTIWNIVTFWGTFFTLLPNVSPMYLAPLLWCSAPPSMYHSHPWALLKTLLEAQTHESLCLPLLVSVAGTFVSCCWRTELSLYTVTNLCPWDRGVEMSVGKIKTALVAVALLIFLNSFHIWENDSNEIIAISCKITILKEQAVWFYLGI